MGKNQLKAIKSSKSQPPKETSRRRKALQDLAEWEEEFQEGKTKLSTSEDAKQDSAYLKKLIRAMSGDNHSLCRRKLEELSNRIEDATIDEVYPEELLLKIVHELRDAADFERAPQHSAPWSDQLADLGWKTRQLQLANYLWSKNPKALDKWKVDLAEVKLAVWGSEDAKTSSIRSIASRLKDFLVDRDLPIKISVSAPKDAAGYVEATLLQQ
ncbi:hypothetical protein [Aporhodopirellula aestuarii]|uniref:Uncharacterized protein n=1 Tax=Aporhodopirellula aestuarii TaxID=2950107 RepID=A0ABT0UAT5_9BACT|nr:hypothetical protein [Aporhodopirellula aestuarii]MCM2373925.1 hypothetical protein [Aporhodopirellula aestuarii]